MTPALLGLLLFGAPPCGAVDQSPPSSTAARANPKRKDGQPSIGPQGPSPSRTRLLLAIGYIREPNWIRRGIRILKEIADDPANPSLHRMLAAQRIADTLADDYGYSRRLRLEIFSGKPWSSFDKGKLDASLQALYEHCVSLHNPPSPICHYRLAQIQANALRNEAYRRNHEQDFEPWRRRVLGAMRRHLQKGDRAFSEFRRDAPPRQIAYARWLKGDVYCTLSSYEPKPAYLKKAKEELSGAVRVFEERRKMGHISSNYFWASVSYARCLKSLQGPDTSSRMIAVLDRLADQRLNDPAPQNLEFILRSPSTQPALKKDLKELAAAHQGMGNLLARHARKKKKR